MAGKLERGMRVPDVRPVQGIVWQRLGPHGARAGGSHDERLPAGHQGPGDGVASGHGIGERIDGESLSHVIQRYYAHNKLYYNA